MKEVHGMEVHVIAIPIMISPQVLLEHSKEKLFFKGVGGLKYSGRMNMTYNTSFPIYKYLNPSSGTL